MSIESDCFLGVCPESIARALKNYEPLGIRLCMVSQQFQIYVLGVVGHSLPRPRDHLNAGVCKTVELRVASTARHTASAGADGHKMVVLTQWSAKKRTQPKRQGLGYAIFF